MRAVRILLPGLAALVLAGVATVQPVRAQEQPTGISVRGQGVVSARPDVAFLTLGASVRAATAAEAFAQAQQRVAALTDVLKANGVLERDIQTRQFSLNPEYGRSTGDAPPPLLGWRANNTVTAKLRDFARIGAVVDAAVTQLGADASVQGISFGIEDTNALIAQARAEAVANARAAAEDLAARAGVRLGRVAYVNEISSPPPTPVRTEAFSGARAAVAAPMAVDAQISPGEQSLMVSVEMRFDIAP